MMRYALGVVFLASAALADVGLTLRYDRPAAAWTEALPIGNGRMGGMVFGGITNERVQFNEQTLWLGDEIAMGSYQPFGDLFIDLGHGAGTDYARTLDLASGVHRVTYTAGGIRFTREAFASFPDRVLVVRLTADQPGALAGRVRLTDRHGAKIGVADGLLTSVGQLTNGLAYEAQVQVRAEGGRVETGSNAVSFAGVDAVVILLAAGTSFANDPFKNWRGLHPHDEVTRRRAAAAAGPAPARRRSSPLFMAAGRCIDRCLHS